MTLDARSTPSQIINVEGNNNLMFVKKKTYLHVYEWQIPFHAYMLMFHAYVQSAFEFSCRGIAVS